MPPRGTYVRDLPQKIDALGEAMYDLDKIGEASRPSLADFTGIPYPTLKAACASRRASDEVTTKLSEACGVHLDETITPWIDKSLSEERRRQTTHCYTGRDTADLFRTYVRQHLSLSVFGKRGLR